MNLLPHAPEAEKALLGGFLRFPMEIGAMLSARGMTSKIMHLPSHVLILQALQDMWAEQRPIDPITLSQEISKRGELIDCGGYAFLSTLSDNMPTLVLAESYLETLEEMRIKREIIKLGTSFSSKAFENDAEAATLVSELTASVQELESGKQRQARTMKSLLKDKMNRITTEEVANNVIRTGFTKLDKESPLYLGDMPIISGETKAGKTSFALSIGANVAIRESKPVLYIGLEDASEKPIDRVLAGESRIPIDHHHKSKLSDDGFNRLVRAIGTLAESRFVMRDDVHELGEIVATIRQFKQKHPDAALVIIDYAQLVVPPVKHGRTREQEIATISRTLRLLALKLEIAIIVLSQLNDDGKTRESRALENDMTAHWSITLTEDHSKRMLTIPRQRNGTSGIAFPITFLGHLSRFENYVDDKDLL